MARTTGMGFATRSEVLARQGIAATSQPLATQAAIDVLRRGGSATDAAIAANAVLGVVEPTGCGIGGDLFAVVWDELSQRLDGLNASGRSPLSLSLAHLRALGVNRIPSAGPLSVSVPGCVDGWFELHAKYGKLPMDEVLASAVTYAHEGFPVTEVIADAWAKDAAELSSFQGFGDTFLPNGRPPEKGTVFRNEPLSRTLETIGRQGRDAFYRGEIAEVIDRSLRRAGGFLSLEDLEAHRSEWVTPLSTRYRGLDIWELPPNGQGIAALQILNLMEAFDITAMGFGSADYLHHLIEAKRLAFEDRAHFYTDPDFADIPVEALVSKEYANIRREQLDPAAAAPLLTHGDPVLSTGDTVYLTTADADGNMVSLIQSNFRGMGSGVCPDGLGFGLQDRGELFALEEGHRNIYAPGKRPFHTIIPAFATRDGRPFMSFGVMGGDVQPQMHAQIVMNIVDFGMNVQEAGDAPRVFHTGSSEPTGERGIDAGSVHLEDGFSEVTRRELTRRGHHLTDGTGGFGGYQAIRVDEHRTYYGASESRKDGHAAGF